MPKKSVSQDVDVEEDGAPELTANLSDPVKGERGAQNRLTGAARAAARGGLHGSIEHNTIARDQAVARGEAGDGLTVDGSTPDGRLPPDVVDGADQPRFGPPGQGEGKAGFRPGDEKIAQAHAEAAQDRAAARSDEDNLKVQQA